MRIILSSEKKKFVSSFPSLMPFFPCLNTLATVSKTMLNTRGDGRHPSLIIDL